MTYGLATVAPNGNGPAGCPGDAQAMRASASTWRGLDADRRLRLVDCALNPASDFADGFPIAL